MAMGKRKSEQAPIWIPTSDLPVSPGHPFYGRLIALETHRAVFTWVQERLAAAGLLTGRTVAIDATTLEANAAMRSIVRRDTGESYQEFLTRLAAASGIKTPTREALARLDRRRKKRTSNKDWENPSDPDAKITKMKDGRTHLAHKAEHAVDLDSSALVAVTLHGADVGDTTSLVDTAIAAAEQIEAAHATSPTPAELAEIVADKGYHSNQTLIDLEAVAVRSYIAEPERGRRDWTKTPEAQSSVYGNRRRVRQAIAAVPRRVRRALLRPPVRHRRPPPHAPARPSEHPEAAARPRGRVQSWLAHAEGVRVRHAARAARTPVRPRRA